MKYERSFARRIVRSFLLLAMKKIRRNEERGCFVWKRKKKEERRSCIDNDDNNGINLVALDRFPCWRERGLQ